MSRRALVVVAVALSLLAAPWSAAALTLPVIADASVFSSSPDTNYGASDFEGGLWTGQTSGTGRFFLKFQLPALVPGTMVTSATLTGTYTFDLLAPDTVHEYWSSKEHEAQPAFSLDVTIEPIPEPGTAGLLALGLLALAGRGRLRPR